jgi:mannose-1-phosphate guanylyltransferase/phosphomannomutase
MPAAYPAHFRSTIPSLEVVILAAGEATRMRPLLLDRPKVLSPVCNVSILRRTLELLQSGGQNRATLALRAVFESCEDAIQSEAPPGFHLDISFLPARITGGVPCVRAALKNEAASILVIYGDSLLSFDLGQLISFHGDCLNRGGQITMLCHRPSDLKDPNKQGKTYHGVVSKNEDGRVTKFIEKPDVTEIGGGFDLANAAVFFCQRELIWSDRFAQARDFSFDIFEHIAKDWPGQFYAFEIGKGFRFDVGSLRRFFELNIMALNRSINVRLPGTELLPGVWVGKDARLRLETMVAPVLIGDNINIQQQARIGPNVVLGNRVQIGERTIIQNAVILDDAEIGSDAVIDSCIIGARSRVGSRVVVPPRSAVGPDAILGEADLV